MTARGDLVALQVGPLRVLVAFHWQLGRFKFRVQPQAATGTVAVSGTASVTVTGAWAAWPGVLVGTPGYYQHLQVRIRNKELGMIGN